MTEASAATRQRLGRLQAFLQQDPNNATLLADSAQTAFEAGDLEQAQALLERAEALAPLASAQRNLLALIALAKGRFQEAREGFARLLADGETDPAIRLNLAWSEVRLTHYADALTLLDDAALSASPRGPVLKVQALHFMGRLEQALAYGETVQGASGNTALSGALASVALDAGKLDLARRYAASAGNQEDGLSTLGMLALSDERPQAAIQLFDQALDSNQASARAWVGKGLGLLAEGRFAEGASCIDRGAALFENHLGSWIAAGWAHFSSGDSVLAHARFQRALALDDRFAEAQGALAVLDVMEGRLAAGERRADVALRLDRRCLSGALAKSLLLARAGDLASADRIRQIALNTPIGPGGKTIAQALPALLASTVSQRPR